MERAEGEAVDLPFSDRPGRRERHLRRRHLNPLFAWPPEVVEHATLIAAQQADSEEMESFRDGFRTQVQKAVDLQPNAGSDTVLALKEELEKLYEQACGLPGEHDQEKAALRKLIGLVMKAVRDAAGNDPLAQRELQDEEQARAIHFRLLEQPLVADILHPHSPVGPDELIPALLSTSEIELDAVMEIFDDDQLALLVTQGRDLLNGLDGKELDTTIPRQRLAALEKELAARTSH